MPSTPRASASIIVAGIFAIFGGALGVFFPLLAALITLSTGAGAGVPFPAALRPFLYGVWTVLILCALFLVVIGIQVIRLRNWARISLLVIAGLMLCFGVMGIV